MPATIALGAFTFTMDALPGSPQIQNIIPTTFMAPPPGPRRGWGFSDRPSWRSAAGSISKRCGVKRSVTGRLRHKFSE
ncbi:hypothetical protein DMH27_13250 [Raoultella planticola]|nr:hypothetical protein [Raoultella planticola]